MADLRQKSILMFILKDGCQQPGLMNKHCLIYKVDGMDIYFYSGGKMRRGESDR